MDNFVIAVLKYIFKVKKGTNGTLKVQKFTFHCRHQNMTLVNDIKIFILYFITIKNSFKS